MVLRMQLTPRLILALECQCCGQLFNEQKRNDTAIDIALFGATKDPYLVCPVCLQMTNEQGIRKDPEYQRKARVEMYLRYGVVVRTHWNPDYSEPPSEVEDEPLRGRRRRDDD